MGEQPKTPRKRRIGWYLVPSPSGSIKAGNKAKHQKTVNGTETSFSLAVGDSTFFPRQFICWTTGTHIFVNLDDTEVSIPVVGPYTITCSFKKLTAATASDLEVTAIY
jgi:hypothetical protein